VATPNALSTRVWAHPNLTKIWAHDASRTAGASRTGPDARGWVWTRADALRRRAGDARRASLAGRPIQPARVQTRPSGQENADNATEWADANRQTQSGRPIFHPKCGRELGQRGQPRVSVSASSCPPLAHLAASRLQNSCSVDVLRLAMHAVKHSCHLHVLVCAGDQCRCLGDHA
jgi:hypothetical protein